MIELFNRVKHIVQRCGKLEQRNLIPNCTEKGQLCTCQYGEGYSGGGGGGGRVTIATLSPRTSKSISQQILSQMTNWGKWAWQKIMDYLTSTQHAVCSPEGRHSFKIDLLWGWPYGSGIGKYTLHFHTQSVSIPGMILHCNCNKVPICIHFFLRISTSALIFKYNFPKWLSTTQHRCIWLGYVWKFKRAVVIVIANVVTMLKESSTP